MNKLLVLRITLAATAIVGACGGNVVVDTPSTGLVSMGGAGAGASGVGTGALGMGGTGLGIAPCGGSLGGASQCSGSAGAGAGQPTNCAFVYCNGPQNWSATCQGNTCTCTQSIGDGGGSSTSCGCAFPAGTDACASSTQCCFSM